MQYLRVVSVVRVLFMVIFLLFIEAIPNRSMALSFSNVNLCVLNQADMLYDRLDASIKLAGIFTSSSTGMPHVPILDQHFGCGKTSFVWKFRSVLLSAGINLNHKLAHEMSRKFAS